MTGSPPTPSPAGRFPLAPALGALLGARAAVGVFLVLTLLPVCLDDHFRIFHASWWFEHPSFTSSYQWLPGFLYVYGPLVGLTGDTVLAPRLLTLALHLLTVALLAADTAEQRGTRWAAAVWLALSPLSLVLGTVPLTESLSLLAMVGGIVALRRWSATGDPPALLLAAVCAIVSSTLRYELWAFLPLFTIFALCRRPARMPVTSRVLAVLPFVFPLVWTALLWAAEGEPFSYLTIVRDDHFGAGDLGAALSPPSAWVVPVQAGIGALAAVAVLASGLRRKEAPARPVWEAYALVALLLLVVFIAAGEVPSQYPERMFLWCVAFSAMPAARLAGVLLGAGTRRRLLAGAALGAALLAGSAIYVRELPLGIPEGDFEAGLVLRESFARGHLAGDDHVVIEHLLPESTAPFVYANRPRNVHIDALGQICPPRVLAHYSSVCPSPDWTPRVRLALAWNPRTVEALIAAGWSVQQRVGNWFFVLRVPGARPLPLVEPYVFEDLPAP